MRMHAAWILLGFVYPAALAGQSADLHRDVLSNGLEVIVAPAGDSPMVTLAVVVRAGAAAQATEGEEGLPHILEHVLFRAYGGRSGRDFGSFAGELGASYNGATGREYVTYHMTLPDRQLDAGLALLGDLMRSPRFAVLDLTDELRVVRDELERGTGDPYHLLDVHAELMLWGDGFRQRNPIGNLLSIMGARHTDLEDFHRRFYSPANGALVVSGAADPGDVLAAASRHFGGWQSKPVAPLPAAASSPLARDTVFILEEEASDLTMLVRWVGPGSATEPESAEAAALFATMVNLPTSGSQQRLVASGLFDAVELTFERDSEAGAFSLIARTTPERLFEGARALRQEVEVLGQPWSLAEEEVARALRAREVEGILAGESGEATAHRLARAWARGDLAQPPPEVGGEDLRALASTWIAGRPRVTGFLIAPAVVETHYDALVGAVQFWSAR